MIIIKSIRGKYYLRANGVPADELITELVRALDMVCKDIAIDSGHKQQLYDSVIQILQSASRVPYLIPDSE